MIMFVFWLIGIATIILQTTVLQGLPNWVSRPDFLFILFIFIAYRLAWIPGILIVFTLSWTMDVISGVHLGFYPLICLFILFALKILTHKNPIKESTYQIPLLGAMYLIAQFLQHIVYSFWLDQVIADWQWETHLLDVILLMIVAIPMFAFYNVLLQFLITRKQKKQTSLRTHRRLRKPVKPVR